MIRLCRLDVQGFKSGPNRYDLHPLTMVFGPNGRGKTRLLEAIAFLHGAEVSGASVNGAGLRALSTAGVDMVVTGHYDVDGVTHTVERARRWNRGSFGRSVVKVDGVEGDPEALLGRLAGTPGRVWLDQSEERLTVALAAIGARRAEGWFEDLRAAFAAYSGELAPPNSSDPSVILSGAYDAAKRERDATRRALRGLEGSVDRSRSEVGQHVDPGAVAAAEAALNDAQAAQRQAIGEHAQAEATLAQLRQQIAQGERALGEAREREAHLRASSGSAVTLDLEAARADEARAAAAVERAQAAVQAAQAAEGAARAAQAETARQAAQAAGNAAQAAQAAEVAQNTAGTVSAPCQSCDAWIDAEAHYQNPFTEARALASECPFVADAAAAAAQLPALDAAAAEATGAAEAAAARAADADGSWRSKAEALAAARQGYREADNRLQAIRKRIAAVTGAPGAAEVERAAAQVTEITIRLGQLNEQIGAAQVTETAAAEAVSTKAAAAREADAAYRAAVDAHAKLERLTRDRQLREAAEVKAAAAAALLEAVQEIQARVRGAGAALVIEHAQPFVPWTVEIRDRVGLITSRGHFAPGPALSASQAATLALGIDRALDAIYDRRFRLSLLELEHADEITRDHVLRALAQAVDAGRLSQAIVCQWQQPGWAMPGEWQVVDVSTDPPADPPATTLSSKRASDPDPIVEGSVATPEPEPEPEPYDGPCHRYTTRDGQRQIVCQHTDSPHGSYHDDAVDCPECLGLMAQAREVTRSCRACAGSGWSRSASDRCRTCEGKGSYKATVYPDPAGPQLAAAATAEDVASFVEAASGPALTKMLEGLLARGEWDGDHGQGGSPIPHRLDSRRAVAREVLAGRTLDQLAALLAEVSDAQ